MKITQLATTRGGVSQPAAARWPITSPFGAPPTRVFRRTFYLSLPLDGIAGALAVNVRATALRANFLSVTYDARAPAEPSLAAGVAASNDPTAAGASVVTLDAPRRVAEIQLKAGVASGPDRKLEFYRLDKNVLSSKATLGLDVPAGNVVSLAQEFIDARFALRLKNKDQSYHALAPADIAVLKIQSRPTGPRIGVADADDLSTLFFFWQSPGELADGAPAAQADAGADFASASQRILDAIISRSRRTAEGFNPPRPPAVTLALVVESDSPCDVNVMEFGLDYNFVLEGFEASVEEKKVLRFAGRQATTESVSVRLPGIAHVESAVLRIFESFRPAGSAPVAGEDENAGAPPAQKSGVYVGVKKWVAQPFTPPQDLAVNGLSLGLMGLVGATELSVEIQEDWQEGPSGRKLLAVSTTIETAGEHAWVTVRFREAISLSPQTHWLMLKAARGEALWLTKDGASGLLVVEKGDEQSARSEVRRLENVEALYRLFSSSGRAQEEAQPRQASVLTLGGTPVAGTGGEDDKTFNLKSALNKYLAAHSQPGPVSIQLSFTSELPGLITIYPPHIVYDV